MLLCITRIFADLGFRATDNGLLICLESLTCGPTNIQSESGRIDQVQTEWTQLRYYNRMKYLDTRRYVSSLSAV